MYKLLILFFFLTVFSSQSLMDSYQLKFANENASYILQIKEGSLTMENQPDVIVTVIAGNNSDTDKKTNKIYKITKGSSFEEGLKIGGEDLVSTDKIGGEDIVSIDREMNPLFGVKEHQAYEIILSYALVRVVEKSTQSTKEFPIADGGIYLKISENKFSLF